MDKNYNFGHCSYLVVLQIQSQFLNTLLSIEVKIKVTKQNKLLKASSISLKDPTCLNRVSYTKKGVVEGVEQIKAFFRLSSPCQRPEHCKNWIFTVFVCCNIPNIVNGKLFTMNYCSQSMSADSGGFRSLVLWARGKNKIKQNVVIARRVGTQQRYTFTILHPKYFS